MDEVQIIRQYINDQVSSGAKREDVIEDLRQNKDPRIQYFIKDYLGETEKQKEEPGLGQLGAETAAAAVVGKKILDMFGKGPVEPPSPPPSGGAVGVAPVAPAITPAPAASPIPPASNVGQQMQGLDWEKLPQWQKDVLLSGYKAELDKQNAQSFEATRMAKQKEAVAAINQSPTAAQTVQQTVAPTVAQTAQQAAPAVTQAAQTPAVAIPPATEEKAKTRKPKTKLTYEAGSQFPEGMVFKEGFGGADNWMKNSFNDESRIMIRDLFNEGKPYGQNMEKAYVDARKYEDWLKQNIPVQTYARTERKAAGLPPPENYGKLGTAIKVGGIGGLLMTAGQAANAKQAAQDVGEALLPIGMTPSDLASGTLTEKQLRAYQEAQKLGSPYRSVPPPR